MSELIMKRGIFILLCVCLFVACSNQKFESQEIMIEHQSSEGFDAVLNSIAALNDTFGCNEISTRSDLRNFFHQVADYAGGFYFGKLGADCGVYIAGSTGSVALGAFLGSALTVLGGIGGSVVASAIFDYLWPAEECSHSFNSLPGCIDTFAYCPFEGPSGSLHNTILYTLKNNGKDYVDGDGNVLVEEMFRDALEYEDNLHLPGVVYDSEYINNVESFCKDLYSVIKDAKSQGLPSSRVCDEIYGLLRTKGCSQNEVMKLKALGDALLPCVSLDTEDVPAYEHEFISIIESSGLEECDKVCFETAGSIYIHSVQYWY